MMAGLVRARAIRFVCIASVLAMTMAGCGSSDEQSATTTTTTSADSRPSPTNPDQTTTPDALPPEDRRVVELTGEGLTVADIVDIAESRASIAVSDDGMQRIKAARAVVDHYIDKGLPAYGITTMYGADFKTTLPPEQIIRFGRINIIQEATRVDDGSQPIVDTGTMRAAWALLVNSYARGFSGASPDLVSTLVDRVNTDNVPDDVEFGNSMGDADLIANAQAAMSLLTDPKFELKAGEATNLLTHNFISVALAAQVVHDSEAILAAQETSLALTIEGFRANLAPLSQLGSRQDVLGSRQSVSNDLNALLKGSLLWKPDGPRQLQDFLSLRDGAENLAALRLEIDQFVPVLEAFANSNQGSPVVDVKAQKLVSVPDFDTTQVALGMDGLRQALGIVAVASNSRALKMLSPFLDLPSGLVSGNPNAFNGLYTRNVTYLMTSIERAARLETAPIMGLTESYMAEGDEDYSPAFPNSVLMARELTDRVEKVGTIEALIGSFALQRRVQSGELTADNIPPALRDVQHNIIKRSPMALAIDRQYDLAPLLEYYVGHFQQR
jgi:histidine ammonia-lyase